MEHTGSSLESFIATMEQEFARTKRVIDAFPAGQADFKPHERSSTARQLVWTFVIEERMMYLAAKDGDVMGKGFVQPPETWEAIRAEMQRQHDELIGFLSGRSIDSLAPSVKFFTGPGQMGDIPVMQFLWFMLHDHIHHRGQLSVYLRMAGGKVPSIYGPSADEKWS